MIRTLASIKKMNRRKNFFDDSFFYKNTFYAKQKKSWLCYLAEYP